MDAALGVFSGVLRILQSGVSSNWTGGDLPVLATAAHLPLGFCFQHSCLDLSCASAVWPPLPCGSLGPLGLLPNHPLLRQHLPHGLLATWMGQAEPDSDIVELSVELAGLSITVRGSPAPTACLPIDLPARDCLECRGSGGPGLQAVGHVLFERGLDHQIRRRLLSSQTGFGACCSVSACHSQECSLHLVPSSLLLAECKAQTQFATASHQRQRPGATLWRRYCHRAFPALCAGDGGVRGRGGWKKFGCGLSGGKEGFRRPGSW